MVVGEIAGSGVHIAANGDRYEGTFEKGLADGESVLSRANGSLYTGSFPAGKPNGDGVFTCSLLELMGISGNVHELMVQLVFAVMMLTIAYTALYMAPPAHAIVLSIDEKSQIQALDRT